MVQPTRRLPFIHSLLHPYLRKAAHQFHLGELEARIAARVEISGWRHLYRDTQMLGEIHFAQLEYESQAQIKMLVAASLLHHRASLPAGEAPILVEMNSEGSVDFALNEETCALRFFHFNRNRYYLREEIRSPFLSVTRNIGGGHLAWLILRVV